MADPTETLDFVEIYHTPSTFAAQKILDVILIPADINAILRDREEDPSFPGAGQPGEVHIAVPKPQVEKARTLIHEAVEDGFLNEDDGEDDSDSEAEGEGA